MLRLGLNNKIVEPHPAVAIGAGVLDLLVPVHPLDIMTWRVEEIRRAFTT